VRARAFLSVCMQVGAKAQTGDVAPKEKRKTYFSYDSQMKERLFT
jgi:hypothetical protein